MHGFPRSSHSQTLLRGCSWGQRPVAYRTTHLPESRRCGAARSSSTPLHRCWAEGGVVSNRGGTLPAPPPAWLERQAVVPLLGAASKRPPSCAHEVARAGALAGCLGTPARTRARNSPPTQSSCPLAAARWAAAWAQSLKPRQPTWGGQRRAQVGVQGSPHRSASNVVCTGAALATFVGHVLDGQWRAGCRAAVDLMRFSVALVIKPNDGEVSGGVMRRLRLTKKAAV